MASTPLHPSTAIVLDLLRNVGTTPEARQMVIVKRPDRPVGNVVSTMTRTLTPDTTGRHFRRHLTDAAAVSSATPGGWLTDQMTRYGANGYRLAAAFCVEVTDAELAELADDTTPRALAMRIERARVSVGAETFTGQPTRNTATYATLTTDVAEAVDSWLGNDNPVIAPAGRARASRFTPTVTPAAPVATPTPGVPATTVTPGDKIMIPSNGTTYIARTMEGVLSDVQMLRQGRESNLPIIMESLPGTGKTMAAMAAFGDDLIMMQCNGETTADDFTGGYQPTADAGRFTWVDGPLVQAMEEGRPLLVDEIALADPRAVSVLLSAMDGRRSINITSNPLRGTVTAREGFYVVAAYNANVPGARISEAVLSRFRVQVRFTTDFAAMESLGVPRKIIATARNLETRRISQEIASSPQARELVSFRDTASVFGEEMALRALLASAPEGDRDVWIDVLQRAYGRPIAPLATTTT